MIKRWVMVTENFTEDGWTFVTGDIGMEVEGKKFWAMRCGSPQVIWIRVANQYTPGFESRRITLGEDHVVDGGRGWHIHTRANYAKLKTISPDDPDVIRLLLAGGG